MWKAEYYDGKIITEETVDWVELDKKDIKSLSLLLPNGTWTTLTKDNPRDQFFQLKIGIATQGRPDTTMRSHIIGMITNDKGDCIMHTYDYVDNRVKVLFDNVYKLKFENIGRLNFDLLGIKLPEIITL